MEKKRETQVSVFLENEKKRNPMFGYTFPIDSLLIHNYQEPVEYGSWEEEYENTPPTKIQKTQKTKEKPDVISSIDFNPGSLLYVVWAEWNIGDSFGVSHKGGTEAYGIFADYKSAIEFSEWLKNRDELLFILSSREKTVEEKAICEFETSDGQSFDIGFIPWIGYFESLHNIHITPVYLEPQTSLYKESVPLKISIEIEWDKIVSFYKDSVEGEGVSGAFIAESVKKELENEGVLSYLHSKFDEDEVTSFTIEVRGEPHRILVSKNPLKNSSKSG